jgi:alkylation response protein AidB-like acyl-CoA dehydrogenase
MDLSLTDRQLELVETARRLGHDRFAPRAARHDETATFPFENFADFRDAGFLGLTIPERYGGLGADFETYCLVSAELGRWCGATALTFNMHCGTMLWTSQMIDDLPLGPALREAHERNRSAMYRRVVDDGAVFAQSFSEPMHAAAAGRAPFGTAARKTDGGWRIDGKKHFASLSGAADFYGVLCTEDRGDGVHDAKDTLYLAVPKDTPGFRITGDWDPLGMRATVSRTLELDGVRVADDMLLMPRGAYYEAAYHWPHMFLTLSPTFLGIARGAVDFTVGYLRGEVPGSPPPGARAAATKQLAVADMRIRLEQAEALFLRVVSEAKFRPTKQERLRAYAAQHTVMETANEVCRLALRTCGGRSIMRSMPLERMYRDSRCGSVMLPWTVEICAERIGRESLYEPGDKD